MTGRLVMPFCLATWALTPESMPGDGAADAPDGGEYQTTERRNPENLIRCIWPRRHELATTMKKSDGGEQWFQLGRVGRRPRPFPIRSLL